MAAVVGSVGLVEPLAGTAGIQVAGTFVVEKVAAGVPAGIGAAGTAGQRLVER